MHLLQLRHLGLRIVELDSRHQHLAQRLLMQPGTLLVRVGAGAAGLMQAAAVNRGHMRKRGVVSWQDSRRNSRDGIAVNVSRRTVAEVQERRVIACSLTAPSAAGGAPVGWMNACERSPFNDGARRAGGALGVRWGCDGGAQGKLSALAP